MGTTYLYDCDPFKPNPTVSSCECTQKCPGQCKKVIDPCTELLCCPERPKKTIWQKLFGGKQCNVCCGNPCLCRKKKLHNCCGDPCLCRKETCNVCCGFPCVCKKEQCNLCYESPCVCKKQMCYECYVDPCVCSKEKCKICCGFPCVCKKEQCNVCCGLPCVCKKQMCYECYVDPCICRKEKCKICCGDPCVCKKEKCKVCFGGLCVCKKQMCCECYVDPCVCRKEKCKVCYEDRCVCKKPMCYYCNTDPCACKKQKCTDCCGDPCVCKKAGSLLPIVRFYNSICGNSVTPCPDKGCGGKKCHCKSNTCPRKGCYPTDRSLCGFHFFFNINKRPRRRICYKVENFNSERSQNYKSGQIDKEFTDFGVLTEEPAGDNEAPPAYPIRYSGYSYTAENTHRPPENLRAPVGKRTTGYEYRRSIKHDPNQSRIQSTTSEGYDCTSSVCKPKRNFLKSEPTKSERPSTVSKDTTFSSPKSEYSKHEPIRQSMVSKGTTCSTVCEAKRKSSKPESVHRVKESLIVSDATAFGTKRTSIKHEPVAWLRQSNVSEDTKCSTGFESKKTSFNPEPEECFRLPNVSEDTVCEEKDEPTKSCRRSTVCFTTSREIDCASKASDTPSDTIHIGVTLTKSETIYVKPVGEDKFKMVSKKERNDICIEGKNMTICNAEERGSCDKTATENECDNDSDQLQKVSCDLNCSNFGDVKSESFAREIVPMLKKKRLMNNVVSFGEVDEDAKNTRQNLDERVSEILSKLCTIENKINCIEQQQDCDFYNQQRNMKPPKKREDESGKCETNKKKADRIIISLPNKHYGNNRMFECPVLIDDIEECGSVSWRKISEDLKKDAVKEKCYCYDCMCNKKDDC